MKSSFRAPALAVAILGTLATSHAQYSNPPSWMPMTMFNVNFDTNSDKLSIVSEATKLGAGVYPALVFNTKANGSADTTNTTPANFDPSKPWSVLNGTVFSRRLGWYDPASSSATNVLSQVQAVYGSGASVWISSLSKSDGLQSYLAVGKFGVNSLGTTNADGTPVIDVSAGGYSGIFGTGGSSTNWQWDGQMDHNVYAVALSNLVSSNHFFPPPTNYTSATVRGMNWPLPPELAPRPPGRGKGRCGRRWLPQPSRRPGTSL